LALPASSSSVDEKHKLPEPTTAVAQQDARERREQLLQERGGAAHADSGAGGGAAKVLTNKERMLHLSSLCTSSTHLSMQQVMDRPASELTPYPLTFRRLCDVERLTCRVIVFSKSGAVCDPPQQD